MRSRVRPERSSPGRSSGRRAAPPSDCVVPSSRPAAVSLRRRRPEADAHVHRHLADGGAARRPRLHLRQRRPGAQQQRRFPVVVVSSPPAVALNNAVAAAAATERNSIVASLPFTFGRCASGRTATSSSPTPPSRSTSRFSGACEQLSLSFPARLAWLLRLLSQHLHPTATT